MKHGHILGVAAAVILAGSTASADLIYTFGTLIQDFNSLPASGTTSLTGTVGVQSNLPGTTGFEGTRTGGTGTTLNLIANGGSSNTGALDSYGTGTATERALGTLASGTTIPAFGVEIVNNSGTDLTSFILSVVREQWRSSTTNANTIAFAYGVSGGGATSSDFLTSASLTPLSAFDLVGNNVVASNGALDGNTNGITLMGTIPANVSAGSSLFLRWTDANDAGNDAGLAIDDLHLTGVAAVAAVPEPSTLISAGITAVMGLGYYGWRRRRSIA